MSLTHSQWPEEAHAGTEVGWRVERLDGPSLGLVELEEESGEGCRWADLKEASQSWDPHPPPRPQQLQLRPPTETPGSEADMDWSRPRTQRR